MVFFEEVLQNRFRRKKNGDDMLNLFSVPLILQVLVVVSPDWNATEGTLYRYQRSHPALQWEIYGHPVAVTLGKNGMAWENGRG